MGSTGSNLFNAPAKPKFEKTVNEWMVVDSTKERFAEGWDSGISIKTISRVSTTSTSGRGHSSTEYQVTYKGVPVINNTFATLKQAKDYILKKQLKEQREK